MSSRGSCPIPSQPIIVVVGLLWAQQGSRCPPKGIDLVLVEMIRSRRFLPIWALHWALLTISKARESGISCYWTSQKTILECLLQRDQRMGCLIAAMMISCCWIRWRALIWMVAILISRRFNCRLMMVDGIQNLKMMKKKVKIAWIWVRLRRLWIYCMTKDYYNL